MADDFCVFVLTHGRPDNVVTVATLKRQRYSGPWFLLIDDRDEKVEEYKTVHGPEHVIVFSLADVAASFDTGSNLPDGGCVVYARVAAEQAARNLGYRYYLQLDDDYTHFTYRFTDRLEYTSRGIPWPNLDVIFSLMLRFLKNCPQIHTVALAQGGDFMGGALNGYIKALQTKRKAMNSFFCDVERPVPFTGRMNEDVNMYTEGARRGVLALTILQVDLNQLDTQTQCGGMTDVYVESGTYVKSMYSVIRCPSAVRVSMLGYVERRLHHRVNYEACAVKIVRETHRKARLAPL